ncbi:MAG TPA: alpha/beta hydrolase [Candidatus Cloacimonadota bacterium]|nr:alpha/beta hydrolase [Candidatus Cloacimonadota bacterium]HPS39764.1 alpha/beta hydrolase [Candidatus Cloacimonadota bacterium]
MKYIMILVAVFGVGMAEAQDVTGTWHGILDVKVMQLRLDFHINMADSGLTSTMDSPDQGVNGIEVTSTVWDGSQLTLSIASTGIKYTGTLKGDSIEGTFQQGGQSFALTLTREQGEKKVLPRPQTPVKPFPYYTEEVSIPNPEAGIKLAGTLTLPDAKGKYPAVIMITGSGPQDRDEMIFEHRPFAVIADHLARNGIASLRYDDRGTAASGGDFQAGTTLDFASDAASAVAWLKTRKEITEIGLIGHSEGGIIAPIVAATNPDVDFIILLAGTGVLGEKVLLVQQEEIMRASGEDEAEIKKEMLINSQAFELVKQATSVDELKLQLQKYIEETLDNGSVEIPEGLTREEFVQAQLAGICSPWMIGFLKLDPADYLKKVKCPVLALNGDKDLQVSSKINLPAISAALAQAGNKDVTTREFPGLNHLFQECKTGVPDEYVTIEQTIAPVVLDEISAWISSRYKH